MWVSLAKFVLRYRIIILGFIIAVTVLAGIAASRVQLSYEFGRAIPTDNPKYQDYVRFKQLFGDDGNVLAVGFQSNKVFDLPVFKAYQQLNAKLKAIPGVDDILSVPTAINLLKDSASEKLSAVKIFPDPMLTQSQLDSAKAVFTNLPFYQYRLYNPQNNSFLTALRINRDILASSRRSVVVQQIMSELSAFEQSTGIETKASGLPLIRTVSADRIKKEMGIFLIASVLLSAVILLALFRSVTTTIISLVVVGISVVWSVALLYLFDYKIGLLTALLPSLIVVIGIPNCIYFINKYHAGFAQGDQSLSVQDRKTSALIAMVSKMGIVTLFCNITAAIGFAVFAFTKSDILREFGMVAGIAIMLIFAVSFLMLPALLSLLPAPKPRELKYLHSRFLQNLLERIVSIVSFHRAKVLIVTAIVIVFSVIGLLRLQTVAKIADDLPKSDKLYTDLKWFEQHFKGVMPLEIVIDSRKKRGLSGLKALAVFEKVDSLSQFIRARPSFNAPLSAAEGLKFAKQAFYEGDSANYVLPNTFDGAFVAEYLRPSKGGSENNFAKTIRAFLDSNSRYARISASMADIGTKELPAELNAIRKRSDELFDSSYKVTLTGTSITFLEGSKFIIDGLKESVLLAFGLIAICMLFLFRSFRILICSLIPNLIPLLTTAGIMGWAGVAVKPSTVLIFSVALGIAIDITIRFLVNYKQIADSRKQKADDMVPDYESAFGSPLSADPINETIRQTGISILYTSLTLIAGFIIFCFSSFGGTFALGWLTSATLVVATLTNLILLPVLLGGKR